MDATPAPLLALRPSFLGRDLSDEALRRPAEPSFSREELDAADRAAFARGHAAGLAEAGRALQAEQVRTLQAIAAALHDAATAASGVADEAAASLARAGVAALGAAVPELIRRAALFEAEAMLARLLPGLSREPAVTIAVPGALAARLEPMLARLGPETRTRVTVAGSGDLGPGDVSVTWAAGRAERRPDRLWSEIMSTLEDALNGAEG